MSTTIQSNEQESISTNIKSLNTDVIDTNDCKEQSDPEPQIMNSFHGADIDALLAEEGPTVKAVLLKTDGSAVQIEYNSTPKANHITEILQSPPSIIGQWSELDVILVGARAAANDAKHEKFSLNPHKLRYPFNNDTFYGDVFLYKFSQDCQAVDFSLQEYKAFSSKIAEDTGKVWTPPEDDAKLDEQDEEDFDDEEEDYDEDQAAFEQFEFMQQTIINKVKAEFPQRYGREPTEEELEEHITAVMEQFGVMFGAEATQMEPLPEEDPNDEDYEPDQEEVQEAMAEEIADIAQQQLEDDQEDIAKAIEEEEAPASDANDNKLNDEEFQAQLKDAIQHVQGIAKLDKETIIQRARECYRMDVGQEPTDDMMIEALSLFVDEQKDEIVEEEEEEDVDEDEEYEVEQEQQIDAAEFEKELKSALDHVRELGRQAGQELVQSISRTFQELNGAKPTVDEMKAIFSRMQDELAAEAQEEFLERNDPELEELDEDANYGVYEFAELEENVVDIAEVNNAAKQIVAKELLKNAEICAQQFNEIPLDEEEDDEEDEEYIPNEEEELAQIEQDEQFEEVDQIVDDPDYVPEEEDDEDDEEEEEEIVQKTTKITVLTTPIKKKANSARVDVYFDDVDPKKTLEFAQSKFEKINHKEPNVHDVERLKGFLETGILFENEVDTQIGFDDEDEEDAADQDYDPKKDTFDYSNDHEDYNQEDEDEYGSDDEDYDPKKDTFDYSNDHEIYDENVDEEADDSEYDPQKDSFDYSNDHEEFEELNEDENQDVSNMVDID